MQLPTKLASTAATETNALSARSGRSASMMANVETGQVLEMYSSGENRWVRVFVAKIDDDRVTLRYEGSMEFMTVELADIESKPDVFRPAP